MQPTAFREAVSVLLVLGVSGCMTPFQYSAHSPPRVFVSHQPILPARSDPITIRANAELAPGRTVRELLLRASVAAGEDGVEYETSCAASECSLSVPASGADGAIIYSARVIDNAGSRRSSAAVYVAQVGESTNQNIPLRVPLDLEEGDNAFRVLLVRDDAAGNYPTRASVLADAERLIYDGLLADPIYRWRDDQLAFYLSGSGGTTSSYQSGLINRCGQDPWINRNVSERTLAETALPGIDALVVLHRRSGPGWRDCSGLRDSTIPTRVAVGDLRAASANGGDPETFVHELGHALFGLSDEYSESTASRTAAAGPRRPPSCACCDPMLMPCLPGQRLCSEPTPPECLSADAFCPPLDADCRGNANVFESAAECNAAKITIDAHPGVEAPAAPLSCRRLCAAGTCPCEPPGSTREVWILDEQTPATPPSSTNDDVMGYTFPTAPTERHGPACAWCAETRFCLRWETARGRTMTEAEAACLRP